MCSYFLRRDDLLTGRGALLSAFCDALVLRLLGFLIVSLATGSVSSGVLLLDFLARERDERVTTVSVFSAFLLFDRVVHIGAGSSVTVTCSFLAREERVVRDVVIGAGSGSVVVVLLARVARVTRTGAGGDSTDGCFCFC